MQRHGHKLPNRMLLGVMIEVPALIWQLDELLPLVDFASVGSNDLFQFMYAADRTNLHVAQRFDCLSRPVLSVLAQIAKKAQEHNVSLTLCGEMAGVPIEALALVALGYRSISMAPASIGPVKAMIRSINLTEVSQEVQQLLQSPEAEIRPALIELAKKAKVEI